MGEPHHEEMCLQENSCCQRKGNYLCVGLYCVVQVYKEAITQNKLIINIYIDLP